MLFNDNSLEELYNKLNKSVNNAIDELKEAKDIVKNMDNKEHWDGNGFNSYNKKFNNIVANFGNYCNSILMLNNNIKRVIQNYRNVDAKVRQNASNLGR